MYSGMRHRSVPDGSGEAGARVRTLLRHGKRYVSAMLDIIYPRHCPVCDAVLPVNGADLCPGCAKTLRPVREPYCLKCGKQMSGDGAGAVCGDCRRVRHAFDRAFALFQYRSIAPSIYRFKYLGRREYAAFYGKFLARRFGETLSGLGVQALVPVPLYPAKKRRRGFNQSEAIARALGKRTGIPVRADLVARSRDTRPQKTLDASARRNNVKNAFFMKKNDVRLKCIVIIDDIYTTGSTVDEIAALFKRSGTERCYVLSLATGHQTGCQTQEDGS